VHFTATVPADAPPGLQLLTADIEWDAHQLREWTEMMVEVTPAAAP
jgi:hypothetical protein